MAEESPGLVPELDVSDLDRSLAVYLGVLGFSLRYARPEERFAYLTRGAVHLMLEEAEGPGRRFHQAPLERPFGRGMNLQIRVEDAAALHERARAAGLEIRLPLEARWYRRGAEETGNLQFLLADPDGYLLRFFSDLGSRPLAASSLQESAMSSPETTSETTPEATPGIAPESFPETSPEARVKRLKIRAWRRGIREMDLILGPFVEKEGAALSLRELDALEALMEVPDLTLYDWFNGRTAPRPPHDGPLFARIRAHMAAGGAEIPRG
ncbi:succinate dehydrogenase assembly factor 2 [Neomegalonema sp.]|uniref:succinate dehydrogenase assembly factor 2 n=1 Tax=Neomegalonema sp. TaxID=2039713 RepID=UPI002633FAD9|nr:succinate dehydrogenase assembly factor 2 [Neomegalonema sp.]MDD2870276.1 succinate dehydrogenase assembly factor 2 [Neomegalonema sp.]